MLGAAWFQPMVSDMYIDGPQSARVRAKRRGSEVAQISSGLSVELPVIATARVRLRAFQLSDISQLMAIANEHHVADSALDIDYPFTITDARRWVQSHVAAWNVRHSLHWAISALVDNTLIGYTGLHHIDQDNRQAQLSFWIGCGAERRGYATEAVQAALAFAFATLEMNRVCAFRLGRDLFASRILTEVGLRDEGLLRQRVFKWDHFEDVVVAGILRSDWLAAL